MQLQTNAANEVIFVFECDHLMKRDQLEFRFLFSRFPSSVKYIVGMAALDKYVNDGENDHGTVGAGV